MIKKLYSANIKKENSNGSLLETMDFFEKDSGERL